MNSKIIAVDFDGTLCENKWPEIGKPHTDVIEYVKKRKNAGDKLIAVKVKNEEISYENVENMFRSWMGGFYKLLSKEQRKNLIGLYEDLFEKSIEIVNKKMIIVDKTR